MTRKPFTRRLPVDLVDEFLKLVPKLSPDIRNATHALEVALREFIKKRKETK